MPLPITPERLLDPVRSILPAEWGCRLAGVEPIWQSRVASTLGVYRVEVHRPSGVVSVIAKVVDTSPRSMVEVEMVLSGALATLPAGLASARCLGIASLDDGCHVMVMEELADLHDGRWPTPTYTRLAYLLGLWGATASAECLTIAQRRPLRDLLGNVAALQSAFRTLTPHRNVSRPSGAMEEPIVRRLEYLVLGQPWWQDWYHTLPVTIVHGDAQRRNAFALASQTIALIDWANLSKSYVGIDIATLVFYAAAYADIACEDVERLVNAVVHAYRAGLDDGGLDDPEDMVFSSVIAHLLALAALELPNAFRLSWDSDYAVRMEVLTGESAEEMLLRRSALTEAILGLTGIRR